MEKLKLNPPQSQLIPNQYLTTRKAGDYSPAFRPSLVVGLSGCWLFMAALVVFSKFHSPTVFPSEGYPVAPVHNQLAGHETGVPKLLLRDLPLTRQRLEVGPEGNLARWHMVIPRNLHSLNLIATLLNFDHLVKMPSVMADPLAGKVQDTGGRTRLVHGWIK
jgi:hypothetical protein